MTALTRSALALWRQVFALSYFIFLASGLCGLPWRGNPWLYSHGTPMPPERVPLWEASAWVWNVLRFAEELQQMWAAEDQAAYWLDIYNIADMLVYITIAAARCVTSHDLPLPWPSTTFAHMVFITIVAAASVSRAVLSYDCGFRMYVTPSPSRFPCPPHHTSLDDPIWHALITDRW